MGYLDATTTGIYRYTRDGARVFRFGLLWRRYVVPDAATTLLERRLRGYHALSFALLMAAAFISDAADLRWPWPLLVVSLLALTIGPVWVVRGLQRAHLTAADLVPVDRRVRATARARALGAPTLVVSTFLALCLGSFGAYTGVTDHLLDGWVLAVLMFAGAAYQLWALTLLRAPDGTETDASLGQDSFLM